MKLLKQMMLCVMIVVSLAGCSAEPAGYEINIENFRSQDGEFQFVPLEWGMSSGEVQEKFKVTWEPLGEAGEQQIYMASEAFAWNKVKADCTCEFKEDKLVTISFMFKPSEAERESFWEELQKNMLKTYGDVDKVILESASGELNITTETECYNWLNEASQHTAMEIAKFSSNGQVKYYLLSVYLKETD